MSLVLRPSFEAPDFVILPAVDLGGQCSWIASPVTHPQATSPDPCENPNFRMFSLDIAFQWVVLCTSYMRNGGRKRRRKPNIPSSRTADDVTALVDALNEAIAAVFNDRQCPRIAAVDTGSDMLAVVVSPADIADAQTIWDDAMVEVGR